MNKATLICDYQGKLAKVKEFQKTTVQCLAEKFYVEGKQKLVLADEVGMGKTYVCRGLIELGRQLKEKEKPLTVVYIAPNEEVSKQNLSELCDGFLLSSKEKCENKRLSMLDVSKLKGEYRILSFSASMFFNTDIGTVGSIEEREQICRYLVNAIWKCWKTEPEEEKKQAIEKRWAWFELLFSAMANASQNGENCRYYYFKHDDNLKKDIPQEFVLKRLSKNYESFRGNCCNFADCLDAEEARFVYSELLEQCGLADEQYIQQLLDIIETIYKETGKNIEDFIKERYALPEKRIELPKTIKLSEQRDTLTLLIPYLFENYLDNYPKAVNEIFRKIREVANNMNFRKLSPDLIILDEFHKYFSKEARKKLEEYLQGNQQAKVLLVSATPYRMNLKSVSLMSEQLDASELEDTDEAADKKGKSEDTSDTCFGQYKDLYQYLTRDAGGAEEIAVRFSKNVEYMDKLQKASKEKFEELWQACIENKNFIEEKLRECMVRTERASLLKENTTEIKEFTIDDLQEEEFRLECKTVKKMVQNNVPVNIALLYSKMAPFPISFMEGYESLGYCSGNSKAKLEFQEHLKRFDLALFWDGVSLPEHFRLKRLLEVLGWSDSLKKALWIPPTGSTRLNGFWKEINELSKVVVFARHIMTIKSVSAILSAQISNVLSGSHTLEDTVFVCQIPKDSSEMLEGNPYVCFYQALKTVCENERKVQKKAKEYTEAFYSYLKAHKNVLLYAGVTDQETLFQYCQDGRLQEVIEEYLFLLTKGNVWTKEKEEDFWEKADKIKESFKVTKCSIIEYYKVDDKGELHEQKILCNIAEMYGDKNKNKEQVCQAFNSPFYPFVLVTTPIAQEGLNFQNYSHKTFHWRIPVSPIDYEQREGRVNRHWNHAVRKSLKQEYKGRNWKETFLQAELEAAKKNKTFGGLNPDWVTTVEHGNVKMKSYLVSQPESKESYVKDILLKAVDNYRVSLGYGITNDVVNRIKENAKEKEVQCNMEEILINLKPE